LREILASYILGFIVGALSFRNMRSKFAPAKQVNDDSAPGRDHLAGTLLVYSVQRRRAVALARRTEFEPASVFGGLWKIPPLHRKTAAMRAHRGLDPGSHVVPLPPSAWAVASSRFRVSIVGGGAKTARRLSWRRSSIRTR
jgi:hypothetical protein